MDKTIWNETKLNEYPKLEEDINCDVLVVGAGIAGILTAHYLKKNNMNVVVVDMGKVGMKKTCKTTAFITALQDVSYHDLISRIGIEKTKLYLDSLQEAILEYKKLDSVYDFDFEEVSSYKYFVDDMDSYVKEKYALDLLNCNYDVVEKVNLPIKFEKAIEFKNQGQMNPMKLLKELIVDLTVYENTKIVKIKRNCAFTESNKIKAKHIVIASGFPFLKFKGLYSLKMYQNKSFVMTCDNLINFKGNIIGSRDSDLYFRDYNGKLIIGGNDIKTGEFNNGYSDLNDFVKSIGAKIEYKWINQDCITLDEIPYIGRLSMFSDNLYVATGFNLWGMTGAMQSALLIKDLICNNTNKYEKLFSPSRICKFKPLFNNISNSIINLFKINKHRCNHLGCSLVCDDKNDTLECPCHGSKYYKNGELIDGPAIDDLK